MKIECSAESPTHAPKIRKWLSVIGRNIYVNKNVGRKVENTLVESRKWVRYYEKSEDARRDLQAFESAVRGLPTIYDKR